jgi:ABC-2 type transport system ATP-binding protein
VNAAFAPRWPPGAPAIRLDGVTLRFPARHQAQQDAIVALDAVSLTVEAGVLFGLLGPNGAGKTTLLRVVCTLLRPSAGRVEVLGHDALRDPEAVRRCLGVVLGGERAVYWRLTGRENLLYAAALHGVPQAVAEARASDLLRMVDLGDRADDLVERYSTGMRQRLALARALMPDPPILILDEPTAGLDPAAVAHLRRLLGELRDARTRAMLLATHHVAEAERLCDVVGILDRGRLVACDSPTALAGRVEGARRGGTPAGSLEAAFLAATGHDAGAGSSEGPR